MLWHSSQVNDASEQVHLNLSSQNIVFIFFDQCVTFVFLKDVPYDFSVHVLILAYNWIHNFPSLTRSDNASANYTLKLFSNNSDNIITS